MLLLWHLLWSGLPSTYKIRSLKWVGDSIEKHESIADRQKYFSNWKGEYLTSERERERRERERAKERERARERGQKSRKDRQFSQTVNTFNSLWVCLMIEHETLGLIKSSGTDDRLVQNTEVMEALVVWVKMPPRKQHCLFSLLVHRENLLSSQHCCE